jgi:hypothetical protein
MEDYPQYSDNLIQERKGVSRFAVEIIDRGLIWRETPNSDVGIDGQVEFRDAYGQATGILVAAQIKSGKSYLVGDESMIHYHPADRHANYWRDFPVPVLLVVHDPATNELYWTDARQQLRASGKRTIFIPRTQTISRTAASDLFATSRPLAPVLEIPDVVRNMAENRHEDPGFRLSFFELFGFGIADIGRKLFFSMSLCMEIVEIRAAEADVGVGVGSAEHEFIDRYIKFLVGQGLIYYDYSDYAIDRDDRHLAPMFLVPLTKRGSETLEFMQVMSNNAFHECLLRLAVNSVHSIACRLERVEQCQNGLLQKLRTSG